eukprot:TRINITY_DN11024_c0_g2_i4.p2 TRINITY_DN11024_c0_g2~~TRINITY_DN11024_c0_g2_i4.p2  ORF type:complete len:144 (+),score=9.65 TRINITY_DN11024_c0_g2_i4:128-559(+)
MQRSQKVCPHRVTTAPAKKSIHTGHVKYEHSKLSLHFSKSKINKELLGSCTRGSGEGRCSLDSSEEASGCLREGLRIWKDSLVRFLNFDKHFNFFMFFLRLLKINFLPDSSFFASCPEFPLKEESACSLSDQSQDLIHENYSS